MQRPPSVVIVDHGACSVPPDMESRPQSEPRRRTCPHCGSERTQGHGSFSRKDGIRQPRRLCQTCGRTFNQCTGTPLHYIKKRDKWARLAEGMVERLSVRRMATTLRVQVSTAFRWRHRLLSPLACQAQPVLTGTVAACEAHVPYSEKGSWYSDGPGARGLYRRGVTSRRPRFRWLADGKPSWVVLLGDSQQQAVANTGQGQPQPEVLQSCLSQMLGPGVELCSLERAPFAEACRRLGISHRKAVGFTPLLTGLDRLRSHLYAWLHRFFGVATRYLDNYLAWLRFADRTATLKPVEAGRQLLVETDALMPPVAVAA